MWDPGCCAGCRRTAERSVPWRAGPSGWRACRAWSPCAGTSWRRALSRPRSRAATRPTTSCTRWRPRRANGSGGDFASRDRLAAQTFGRAAAAAGLERIVYLGGIAPAGRRSDHLRSRLEVEDLLFTAVPGSTALRASIVIGAGSSSFRLLVRLVERLRVLPLPRWRNNRTQPIDERDVIEYLARTPSVPAAAGRALDICGPDRVTFAELVGEIAAGMGVGRMPLGLPTTMTPPASAVVAAVTGQPIELVRPLMESLESDVLPRDPHEAAEMYDLRPRSFARAVDHALAEWEALEPLGAR